MTLIVFSILIAAALASDVPTSELSHLSTVLSSLEFFLVKPECTGPITCADGHVVALDLSGITSAAGSISTQIGYLSGLTSIDLSNSGVTSSVPETIGRLSLLTKLHLQSNHLEGSVPHALTYLTTLVDLDLSNTRLGGAFPISDATRFHVCDVTNTCMDCSTVPTGCQCSHVNMPNHPYELECAAFATAGSDGFLGLGSSTWMSIGIGAGVFGLAALSALIRYIVKCRREQSRYAIGEPVRANYHQQPGRDIHHQQPAVDQNYNRLADALNDPQFEAQQQQQQEVWPARARPASPIVGVAGGAIVQGVPPRPTSPASMMGGVGVAQQGVPPQQQWGMPFVAPNQSHGLDPRLQPVFNVMASPQISLPSSSNEVNAAIAVAPAATPAVAAAPATTPAVAVAPAATPVVTTPVVAVAPVKSTLDSNGYVEPVDESPVPVDGSASALSNGYVAPALPSADENAAVYSATSSSSAYVDPSPVIASAAASAAGSTSPRGGALSHTWAIDHSELELGAVLGEGAFGVVRSGKWRGRTVAVKQIKKSSIGGDKALDEFELEIGRMATLQPHENVVQLYGVVHLPSGDVAAVVEFCAQGALVSALYGAKPRQWTMKELVHVAYDSACGIMHLHANNIIHRDIAARNVLLAGRHDLTAKVADFGMSRSIDGAHSELATATKIGPAKHMAPEQLQRLAYSKASDVFAFAVLLFEIFAREEPWKNVAPINAITKVIAGERMSVPQSAPDAVRVLIPHCWAHDPAQRPDMRAACKVLEEELTRQNLAH